MSVAEALIAAKAARVEIHVEGSNLRLRALQRLPANVVALVSRYKPQIFALLRPTDGSWSAMFNTKRVKTISLAGHA